MRKPLHSDKVKKIKRHFIAIKKREKLSALPLAVQIDKFLHCQTDWQCRNLSICTAKLTEILWQCRNLSICTATINGINGFFHGSAETCLSALPEVCSHTVRGKGGIEEGKEGGGCRRRCRRFARWRTTMNTWLDHLCSYYTAKKGGRWEEREKRQERETERERERERIICQLQPLCFSARRPL